MTEQKSKGHLFQKGKSGNPAGRPAGSRNQISILKMQVEGELRSQMKDRMQAVVEKMIEGALAGDVDLQKTLFKSWISGVRSADEEPAKEKIQIVIGKLDQIPAVKGRVITDDSVPE